MTPRFATAAKVISPFLAAELLVMAIIWFVVPEGSWLTYALGAASLLALPLLAAVRLVRASFGTSFAVFSAILFPVVGLTWAACAAALGFAADQWQPYLLGATISTVMFIPLQLLAAYIGAWYGRSTIKSAT